MSLRAKTLAAVAATLFALLALLHTASREIVQGGFDKVERASLEGFASIERADALRNVDRVSDALALHIDTLSVKVADWAQWDDTYRFVKDHNRAFVASNLTLDTLPALKIDVLVIVDAQGAVVSGLAYDREKEAPAPLPAGLLPHLAPGGLLMRHQGAQSEIKGVLALPETLLMVASRPVVRSSGEGPASGAVIFGRLLDAAEFAALSELTHLSIVPLPASSPPPQDFRDAIGQLTVESPVLVREQSEETISGYTRVLDLTGAPAVYLRVDIPREIYRQGIATAQAIRERGRIILAALVASVLIVGVALALVIGAVIERWVLSRLARLSKEAVTIGAASDFSARVASSGEDEIARLARSLNKMLDALQESHLALERRNSETRLLMDTLPTGLLSLDEDFRINPEMSLSAREILADPHPEGKRLTEVLGLTAEGAESGKALESFLDVLRRELMDDAAMAPLNPLEELRLDREGREGWVRLRFFNIRRGPGLTNHLLVVMKDISEEKRLAREVASAEREKLQLKAIAEDPELFREFLAEAAALLRSVRQKVRCLAPGGESASLVGEVFRGVHGVKGMAASFGLAQLSEAAGGLEESLDRMRAHPEEITGEHIAEVDTRLAELDACFLEARESARRVLGDDVDVEGGVFLRIGSDEIRRHIREIQTLAAEGEGALDAGAVRAECVRRLEALRAVPARRGLARALKIVPGLIERLGKEARFEFKGGDVALDCDLARELNTPLIHLIRNAMDHGIEDEETRVAQGKPPVGRVTLAVRGEPGCLRLELSDDGKGLDPAQLKDSAARRGFLSRAEAESLTDEAALALIFRPGFSTVGEATDISGRGVGLDAARSIVCRALGGTIRIESEAGRGTRFLVEIPLGA